ncbi:MAG TPA: phosphatidylserine/phosphatidylglycerophosphate/cardiolipin synthase family protein [Gemmataceae bacterium]|nr:phosphatidylserine/phosphatidylglycerophosphate/cardiolipin synthase family protein [Gemmataceae bacterium]
MPPPGRAEGITEDAPSSRNTIHRRQVIRDSTTRIAVHPLATAKVAFLTPLRHWWTVGSSTMPEGAELHSAHIHLLPDGHDAFAALSQIIDQSTQRLDVVMFIWNSDPVGEDLARRLAAKAALDLPVRVLVDGGGNLLFGMPAEASAKEVNRVITWLAGQPNVQVIRMNNPFCHYDHRKLVLADSHVAWTGGRNFTERGFFHQHDLSFTVTGPLVEEMQDGFDCSWKSQGGTLLPPLPPRPIAQANASARLVGTEPPRLELEQALYGAVDAAQRHIYLANYALCDGPLIRKLIRARRRGVDVRVATTLKCTTPILNCANKVVADRLLRAGIRVYLYPGMTHVKALSADGCWAYVGSGNFDPLSLRRNHELGLAIEAGAVIPELDELLFRMDFRPEWEIKETLSINARDRLFELVARVAF